MAFHRQRCGSDDSESLATSFGRKAKKRPSKGEDNASEGQVLPERISADKAIRLKAMPPPTMIEVSYKLGNYEAAIADWDEAIRLKLAYNNRGRKLGE